MSLCHCWGCPPVPRLTTWHVCSINPSREALLTTWHIYPLVFSVRTWIHSASSSIQHLACHWLSPLQHVQWHCGSVVTDEEGTESHSVLCKNPRAWALSWEHGNQNSWCQGSPAVRILSFWFFFKNKFIYVFIYFWLCWVFVSVRGLSLVAASGGHSSLRCAGLSLSRPLLLRGTGSRRAGSVVVAHGPSCSAACGIFPDRGTNPCPLH